MASFEKADLVLFLLSLVISSVHLYAIDEVISEDGEEELVKQSRDDSVFDQIANHNRAVSKGDEKTWLFEADIALVDKPEDEDDNQNAIDSKMVRKRGLRRSQEYLWIDRVVPYEYTNEISVSGQSAIDKAMQEISTKSCISFVKRTTENNWVKFVNRGACFSSVGRSFWRSGSQEISLAPSCLTSHGTIMHEILHSLGFWHEQSRPDRNQFVEIMWENIAEGEEHNFAKYTRGESDDLNSQYDLSSIMHYGRFSFSKNGQPTVLAISDPNKRLGQREKLSEEDVIQLNALYRCKDVGKTYSTWSEWSPCSDKCVKTRQRFCPNYNKASCPDASRFGVHTEHGVCTQAECNKKRDGHWGRWSSWGECSHKCGQGTQQRTRKCDDPAPKNGGKHCPGEPTQSTGCFLKPCGLGANDCLFDGQGMCFWTDASSSTNYMWKRHKGKTPSGRTGPDCDHSTEQSTRDGHYMYTESSSPARTGNKASLISNKIFSATLGRCVTFFYSMHGLGCGAMRLFVVDVGSGVEHKVWEKTGPQGSAWKEAEVDVPYNTDYKIRFESERGPSFQGDLGLDDIFIAEAKCSEKHNLGPNEKPTTTPVTTTTTTTTTTTRAPTTTMDPLFARCGIQIKPVGCFADFSSDPAMPYIIESFRPGSPYNYGNTIDWNNYEKTLNDLLCSCLNRAKDRGMKYIGHQFYGECWGSMQPTYNRYGHSDRCINTEYKKECYGTGSRSDICMGQDHTNYVYEIL
ncbi:uncharacterized protein [Clytia hemisphaerica]|uniref:Metalloendopeptidase n=1 Tax=Clytia hemisphaerica TaxID=252671 RepID=A0A7M5V389_9CNID